MLIIYIYIYIYIYIKRGKGRELNFSDCSMSWLAGLEVSFFPRQVLIRGGRALHQSEQKEGQGRGMELGAEAGCCCYSSLLMKCMEYCQISEHLV
jgi:hypothetical protein